jgi:menaquinone-dependent protoporphyrinogen oxidase
MKIAILYGSKYGATECCAKKIASELNGQVELINIFEKKPKLMSGYDFVLMGGAVYVGKMADDVIHGIKGLNLGDTPYGLFICCKDDKKKAVEYLRLNLGDKIVDHAMVVEHLGHAIHLERMNFFARTAMKTMFKIKSSYSDFNSAAIHRVADQVNRMGVSRG